MPAPQELKPKRGGVHADSINTSEMPACCFAVCIGEDFVESEKGLLIIKYHLFVHHVNY